MTEQSFREIQLSGKQLVFLFMTAVVVAVGVFLLGVSVGRGVRTNVGLPAGETVDRTAEVVPPASMPPPTEVTPEDQAYHGTLRGETTPPAEPQPPPVAEVDPVVEPVPAEPPPTTTVATTTTVPPAPAPAATTKPAPPAASGWMVQVGAYRSRENADRQARQLSAKGFPASAVAPSAAGGLYRVRVGPYPQRAEADRVSARLRREEGISSSVSR